MAHAQHGHNGKARGAAPSWIPSEFARTGGKPVEALIEMQKQLIDSVDEANRAWLARARLEAVLGIEFVSKLTAARSIPDVATAYRECMTRQLDMLAEDGRRMFDDSKRFLKSGVRFLSTASSGPSNPPGIARTMTMTAATRKWLVSKDHDAQRPKVRKTRAARKTPRKSKRR